ncbi:MAG: efflux RND transporter permease subunit [Agathobacter sp.]|uniref:efflux RND transporter permease subunit n=1 Tax=Agathobacter sp. TaxID=2021311 RepID=UPI003993FD26
MISKYSVKKPFTVLVGVILVIVLGVVSLSRMTTDLLPDMSFQYALIITTDMGASPQEVESDVTAPIESAMATTSNIKNVSSMSYNSYSIVTCEYEQDANMDSVVIEIQQKIEQVKASWSDGIGTPTIMQINPDMLPIMMTAVDMDGKSESEITDYVENELIPAIESTEGVASVTATGELTEQIEVTLDQNKIDALNEKIHNAVLAKFDDAREKLDSADSQIKQGQSAISNASDQISEGVDTIKDQKTQLSDQKSQLESTLAELNEQKSQLETIQSGISSFMNDTMYTETIPSLEKAKDMPGGDAAKASLEQIDKQIAEKFSGLSELGITVNGYADMPQAASTVAKTLVQVNTGIEQCQSGLEKISEGEIALNDAMDELNSQAAISSITIGQQSAQLATAAASLENSKTQLEESENSALDKSDLNTVLSIDTLSQLLTAQNFDMPAGYVNDADGTQYIVQVGDKVKSVDDLNNLVLMDMNMDGIDPIRVSDVANVEITDNSGDNYAVINGNPGIILSMEKQTGYSTGDVTDRLLDKFDSLEKQNDGLHTTVLMNQGIYIDMVVSSVLQNMIVGAILAIIVLFLFLKDIKPTLVIAASIPLSVIVAVVLMYFTNITLNIISMSGLVLGIGMLVDNSIVVIENIYRLRGEGYSVKKAAVEGAGQVAGAIFASTLTTVSVYAPIIFTDGITRQLFVDLALTVLFTLMASLLVALTFVPAIASGMLKKTKDIKHPWFEKFKDWYGRILAVCLRYKPVVFIVAIALLLGSGALCLSKGMTFMDMDMESDQISLTITAKEDEKLDFDELTAMSDQVIDKISDIKGIDTIGATAGGNSTMSLMNSGTDSVSMYVLLDENKKVSSDDVISEIEDRTKDLDCEVTADSSSMDYSAYFGSGISVKIKGNDIDKLQELASQVAEVLEGTEGVVDVDDGLKDMTNELKITVDKEKAAKYGYTVAQVYKLISDDISSSKSVTTISADIKDYEVYLQTQEQSDVTVDDIKNMMFTYTNQDGDESDISLSDICTIEQTQTLSTIHRDSQTRYITVSGSVDEDHNVTLVSDKVKSKLDKIDMPEGYSASMEGEDETINESMSQLVLMLLLAVVFIYLIMVAQFQSLLSPFIIMFSIPLAFTGGFIALFITGNELGIISMLGFIMLAGLIVNNGIVLIDYINQARRQGMKKHDAIIDAGKTRVRPILMTAMTTILAMVTSAIGIGGGSDMIKPMAITIIGGLVYGTILTLIVIPCIYDAFNRGKNMVEEDL